MRPNPRAWSVGQGDPLEDGKTWDGNHGFDPWIEEIFWRLAWQPIPVFFPGEYPWTNEPGGLQSIGLQRLRHDWSDLALRHTSMCVCFVAQSCLTIWDPLGCSPPVSSIHGDSPSRILEWVAKSSSRASSHPRDWTQVSCRAGGSFIDWTTREAPCTYKLDQIGNGSSNTYSHRSNNHKN